MTIVTEERLAIVRSDRVSDFIDFLGGKKCNLHRDRINGYTLEGSEGILITYICEDSIDVFAAQRRAEMLVENKEYRELYLEM